MSFELFVNGTLMRGLKLHANMGNAEFLGEYRTVPHYRLHTINDVHPGMYRLEDGEPGGIGVWGELYRVDEETWNQIEEGEPPHLYSGMVELEDGRQVTGILYPRALAEAIHRQAGSIVLPTFVQPSRGEAGRLVETAPLRELSAEALLASVNVPIDSDGRVRRYAMGFGDTAAYRPAMAAMLASRVRPGDAGQFILDYAADPRKIDHLSFQDVYENRFDPAKVRGRAVLVGYAGGTETRIDLPELLQRDIALLPLNILRREAAARAAAPELLQRIAEGRLQLAVREFALEAAADAMQWIATRGHGGRAVLVA